MSETAPLQEQHAQEKVSAKNVSESFHGFQRKIKEGFPSQEEELRSYAGMLEVTTTFFRAPTTEMQQAKSIVNTLVTTHKETAMAPIDFFLTVGERLQKTKLSDKDTYRYLGDAAQEELFAARTALRAEEEARKSLERLSVSAPEVLPDVSVGDASDQMSAIKQTALVALEKDPAMAEVLTKTNQYKETLASLTAVSDEAILQETLAPFAEFLSADTIEDLSLHLLIGDTSYVQDVLHDLSLSANDPDFAWRQLVSKESFPSDLYHSFDQLSVMTELVELAHALEGASKETKATHFLPYLQRGMSASLLEEMAEGRFVLPDDFLSQQVETFLDFSQNYEEETETHSAKKHGRTKKIVASALATAIIAVPLVSAQSMMMESQHKEKTAAEKLVPPPVKQKIPKSRPANPEEKTTSKQFNRYHPENSSPEQLMQGQKDILWKLEGGDLNGFYRNTSATKFEPFSKEWNLEKRVIEDQEPNQTSAADIQLSGERALADRLIELPTKSDYALTRGSVRVSGDVDDYSLLQTIDGSYLLEFSQSDIGEKIEVSYGLGKIDHSVIPQPSSSEVQAMLETSITIDQIPEGSLKTFMEKLQGSDASSAQKAKAIEEYIKKNFIYSLDGTISEEYDRFFNSDYFRRIYEIQRGDCDVVNTAFIMLLRAQGIPSRLVFGNAHTGEFINKDPKKITAAEGHGWAEAYVDGGFMQLDATPTTMDEYTKKALEGNIDETLQFSMKQDAADIDSLEQLVTNEDFLKSLLMITGINMSLLAGSMLLRRRNNKAVEKLYRTLADRTDIYLGPDASQHIKNELMQTEWKKLSGLSDEPEFNPFIIIAPGGLYRLAKAGIKTRAIRKVPYSKKLPEIQQTDKPKVTEYLTKALGYDFTEAEVNNFIRDEAYFESIREIRFGMHRIIDELAEQVHISDRTLLTDSLERTLREVTPPKNREEWEEIKMKQRDLLYQTCLTALEPKGWKARLRQRSAPSFEKTLINEPVEGILRLQLMMWKVQGEYEKLSR